MKRTPIRRVGKVGRTNIQARVKISDLAREKNLNICEINMEGCLRTWPLAPAHRHKRAWYKGDAELLSDFKQWVVACQLCHDLIEHNSQLTESIFLELRGKES